MQLSREQLLRAYRQMKTIREFEERLHVEITTGEIAGFTHLYAGQEAVAVGVCENLTDADTIISTHRGHGHCIAKGCDVPAMMKEIYGRRDGLCGGKGGSMHIADVSKGMLGANGIVGGGPPIAVGAALAAKIDKTGAVSVAFGGDGSCNQGTVLEAMNLAVVLKAPVIFLFENNTYSEHTGVAYAVGAKDITTRSAGFGMRAEKGNGDDFFEVYEMTKAAVEYARAGNGPVSLEFSTMRYFGHFEGDPQNYRAAGEVAAYRKTQDCLMLFRDKVTKAKLLDAAALDAVDAEVLKLIDESVANARTAPPPVPDDLYTNVYVSYEGGIR